MTRGSQLDLVAFHKRSPPNFGSAHAGWGGRTIRPGEGKNEMLLSLRGFTQGGRGVVAHRVIIVVRAVR